MKKILFLPAVLSIMMFAASARAETAVPTSAVVTVNGAKVDFCAYNLYDSNYFMLRDVASALSGTDKQFNVGWKNNAVTLTGGKAYEPVGTEFSQNAESDENAAFSVPEVTFGGKEITLVGYNIKDSNYFKIRDIARIFDFAVGYEDGHIAIDTSKPYEAGLPYDGGGVIGMAHEANLPLFINEMPLVSYVSPVDTVYSAEQLERINENPRLNGVYVDAADLENYGFDAQIYEDAVWLTRNKEKKFSMLDGEIINSAPSGISEVCASDMKVYLDGTGIRNVLINGKPYISAAELLKYGIIQEPFDLKSFQADYSDNNLRDRINIDFMLKDLSELYERDFEENIIELDDCAEIVKSITGVSDLSMFTAHIQENPNVGIIKITGGMQQGNWKYIGFGDKANGLNGSGICCHQHEEYGNGGVYRNRRWDFKRGDFVGNNLIDGITTESAYFYTGDVYRNDGSRIEGARMDGYKRDSIVPFEQPDNLRFGYRVEREGESTNGEYCGYYREYDNDGKLIFEGDYSDFKKENN